MAFRCSKAAALRLRTGMVQFQNATKSVADRLIAVLNNTGFWNDKKKSAYEKAVKATGRNIVEAIKLQQEITNEFDNAIGFMKE